MTVRGLSMTTYQILMGWLILNELFVVLGTFRAARLSREATMRRGGC